MKPTLMIVDDSRAILRTLEKHFSENGFVVLTAAEGKSALEIMEKNRPDVVILDIRMPGIDGIEVLEKMKKIDPKVVVIMVTALEDMQTTIRAIQKGAYEYINKPIDLDKLEMTIQRALESRSLKEKVANITSESKEKFQINNIIGKTPEIKEIFKTIGSLTDNPSAAVLITGESGTGKELVAKAIHYNSSYATSPFVAVNCTALTETLLESELFGHVKGAFTGAITDKKGKFEAAGDGSIFLDEVSEMSPALQSKLLRVLQEKEFEPVGGNTTIKCEARVIAATNKDLALEVENGSFREDLYYRLKVVEMTLPPLRERKEDIEVLIDYLLEKIGRELHKTPKIVPDNVKKKILEYDWPGNVRELENMLMRAMVLAKDDVLTEDLFPISAQQVSRKPASSEETLMRKSLADVEKEHIERVLGAQSWNKRRTTEILGITRPTLDKKIKDYGITKSKGDDA